MVDVGTPIKRPSASSAAPPEFPPVISASVLINTPKSARSNPATTPRVALIETRLPLPPAAG